MLRKVLKLPLVAASIGLISGVLTGWVFQTSFGSFNFVSQPVEQILHAAQLGFVGWVVGGLNGLVFPKASKARTLHLFLLRSFLYLLLFAAWTLFLIVLAKVFWQRLMFAEAVNDWLGGPVFSSKWLLLLFSAVAVALYQSFSHPKASER